MLKSYMRLHRQVYIYLSSYVIIAGLSFATVALLTHHLSTYDYGIINLYSSSIALLMPFVTGGVLYPLSVEYFKKGPGDYKAYFTNTQAIPLVSVIFFTFLFIIFQRPLSNALKVSAIWIWILPITAWWIMINETVVMLARNRNKPFYFAFFLVGKNFFETALAVVLVLGLHWKWEGRLTSAVLAPVIMGVISVYLFFRWRLIGKKVDWRATGHIFFLCLPFVFERLAVFVMGNSDKYFIDKYDLNGTREVGLYGLGSQLATIIYLVVISMNSAYQPHLFKKLSEGFKGRIHKSTMWYIGGCVLTVLGMFIAIPIMFRFFIGPDFQDAKPYAYMLCSGFFMWGIFNAFQPYLIYIQRSRVILYISFVSMGTSLALNFWLVPRYGAEGAAIANIITYSVMAVICFLFVRKFFLIQV